MEKKIYENAIEYVLVGNYYLPNIAPPENTVSANTVCFMRSISNSTAPRSLFMVDFKWKAE